MGIGWMSGGWKRKDLTYTADGGVEGRSREQWYKMYQLNGPGSE